MIVFSTQVKVAQQSEQIKVGKYILWSIVLINNIINVHRRFRAGYNQDPKYKEKKTEHVVHLRRPNAVEYEKQLDKDATEW